MIDFSGEAALVAAAAAAAAARMGSGVTVAVDADVEGPDRLSGSAMGGLEDDNITRPCG